MDIVLPEWLVTLGNTLYWVCQVALLIPLWLAWQRRAYWTKPLQVLFWVLVVVETNCFLLALPTLVRLFGFKTNPNLSTWPLFHLQSNFHGLGHLLVFYYAIHNKQICKVIRLLVPVLVALALLDSFYLNPFANYKPNTITQVTESLIVLGLSIIYLEQLLVELPVSRVEHNPMFWVTIYTILFFAGTLIMDILMNSLNIDVHAASTRKYLMPVFGLVSSSVTLLSYVLLTWAYRNCGRQDERVRVSY
ncbi:hypothetical protein HER32_15965 [Hymenobacter sp. BT18]|uniref:hypothetical protein n=1 Tax=Hymenobacter sp. BT18 TaxID=2835648 RepID=UPI00143ED401|nr:hypothetical protein [Hymenobacter sp. BT18]QIX62588.1 hypothetical protein HER32_15965 [Hymenobacter sp. BT18]